MREHGIAVEVTDVGDRYVLERMLETGAALGGEQSGHVIDLDRHTTGDGLATALMLLGALERRGMSMARGRRPGGAVPAEAGGRARRPQPATVARPDLAGGGGREREAR